MIFQQELRTMSRSCNSDFLYVEMTRLNPPRGRCSWIQWLGGQRDRWVRWVTLGLHIFGLHRLPLDFNGFRNGSQVFPEMAAWMYDATWNVTRVDLGQVLGLFGDFLVLHSHGLGRRMFLRIGVIMAAIGILICMLWLGSHQWIVNGKHMGTWRNIHNKPATSDRMVEWSTTNAITVMWFPHLSHQTFDSLGQMPNTTFTGVLAKHTAVDVAWSMTLVHCRVLVVLGSQWWKHAQWPKSHIPSIPSCNICNAGPYTARFMVGILTWRMGECMNDVTMEAWISGMTLFPPRSSAAHSCATGPGTWDGPVHAICHG